MCKVKGGRVCWERGKEKTMAYQFGGGLSTHIFGGNQIIAMQGGVRNGPLWRFFFVEKIMMIQAEEEEVQKGGPKFDRIVPERVEVWRKKKDKTAPGIKSPRRKSKVMQINKKREAQLELLPSTLENELKNSPSPCWTGSSRPSRTSRWCSRRRSAWYFDAWWTASGCVFIFYVGWGRITFTSALFIYFLVWLFWQMSYANFTVRLFPVKI